MEFACLFPFALLLLFFVFLALSGSGSSGSSYSSPAAQAKYFACPDGHMEKIVVRYDHGDPPRCTECGKILEKSRSV